MNNEYNSALNELRFSREAKDRMVETLLAAEGAAAPPRRRRRVRTAALAAAAVLALAVGAGASGLLKPAAEVFAGVFGSAPAQTEIVDKIGRPVSASATAGGVTITADAVIGDRYSYAVVYSLSRSDGASFGLEPNELGYLPLCFGTQDTDVGNRGGAHGSAYAFDADPADNAIQYVEMMTVDELPARAVAKAHFRDLYAYAGDGEREVLALGEWTLKFELDFEDSSVSFPAGQTVDLGGIPAVLNAVTLSPIGLRVEYTAEGEPQWDESGSGQLSEHDRAEQQRYGGLSVVLTMRDGGTLDLTDRLGGGMRPGNGRTVCEKSGVFDELIPLEDVASLTLGGVEFPLD